MLALATLLCMANLAHAARTKGVGGIAQPLGVFGSLEFRTNATQGLGEWRNLLAKLGKEDALYESCDADSADCPAYLREWRRNLQSWADTDILSKLDHVNAYVNARILYTDDRRAFGRRDLWATPAISLKGRGDCEDYAIAKYESLRALGLPEDSLRLVIVDDTRRKLGHAVLTVNTTSGLYVLDNLQQRPYLHGRVSHYAPIYSINRSGRWINVATRKVKPAVVASRELIPVGDMLRPSLAAEDDVAALRPSLAVEPATGVDLFFPFQKKGAPGGPDGQDR